MVVSTEVFINRSNSRSTQRCPRRTKTANCFNVVEMPIDYILLSSRVCHMNAAIYLFWVETHGCSSVACINTRSCDWCLQYIPFLHLLWLGDPGHGLLISSSKRHLQEHRISIWLLLMRSLRYFCLLTAELNDLQILSVNLGNPRGCLLKLISRSISK